MADNTTASAAVGVGDTFATKDILGVKYPRNILTTPAGVDVVPLAEGGAVSVSNFPASQPVTLPRAATATVPAQTAAGITAAQVLAALPARRRLMLVNTGTTVIKIGLGAAPTQTAYHIVLGAGSAADNGTGGSYTDDDWTGAVHVISSAAGGTLVVTELT